MSTFTKTFSTEFKDNRSWFAAWIIGLTIYFLMVLAIYPGEKAMADLIDLLNTDAFKAVLGDFGDQSPGFLLWIALMSSFNSLLFIIFSSLAGTRMALKSVEDKTGELVHTFPIKRRNLLFYRWFVAFTYILILLILWIVPIYAYPEKIAASRLFNLFWVALLFSMMGLSFGMLIGVVFGTVEKGQQIDLFLVLLFYVLQIIGNFQSSFSSINKLNILNWFPILEILLQNKVDTAVVAKLFASIIISLLLTGYNFNAKDLMKEVGFSFKLPNFVKIDFEESLGQFYPIVRIFVIIVLLPLLIIEFFRKGTMRVLSYPLKKRFRIAYDFIESDNITLSIVFWAIVMFYPLQLMLYPGDSQTVQAAAGFGNNALFKLLTYNHNLLLIGPWLWFIVTQAIGGHWIIMVPLVFYWIKKIAASDAETRTGEIVGSLPQENSKFLLQRVLAAVVELIWMIMWMVIWLLLSELVVDRTVNKMWEIIAIASMFPLYYFLLTISLCISMLRPKDGVKISRIFILLILLLFFVGYLSTTFNQWYVKGLLNLYNPVEIIIRQSLSVSGYGVLVLCGLSVISTLLIIPLSKRFTWVIVDETEEVTVQHQKELTHQDKDDVIQEIDGIRS